MFPPLVSCWPKPDSCCVHFVLSVSSWASAASWPRSFPCAGSWFWSFFYLVLAAFPCLGLGLGVGFVLVCAAVLGLGHGLVLFLGCVWVLE